MGVYPLNIARISVLKEKDELTIDNDSGPHYGGWGEPNVNSPCGSDGDYCDKCSNKDGGRIL